MKQMIKLCAKCKKPIIYPNRYCLSCYERYKKEDEINRVLAYKRYNQKRDKKYARFYGSKLWDLLKNKRLQDSGYMCDRCKSLGHNSIATEVHHIKPIQTDEGWKHRLDYDNTTSVCLKCHNYYHSRFQKKEERI